MSVDVVILPTPVGVKGSDLETDDEGFTSPEGGGLESRERVLGCTEGEFDCDCEETN